MHLNWNFKFPINNNTHHNVHKCVVVAGLKLSSPKYKKIISTYNPRILTRVLSQVQAEATESTVVLAVPASGALRVLSLPDCHLLPKQSQHAQLDWTSLHPVRPVATFSTTQRRVHACECARIHANVKLMFFWVWRTRGVIVNVTQKSQKGQVKVQKESMRFSNATLKICKQMSLSPPGGK